MITTDAILVIAACLAIIAAIGVRIALSLRDIEKSLDRVADALELTAQGGGQLGRHRGAAHRPGQPASEAAPTEAEIAAAIAAAARFISKPQANAPRQGPPASVRAGLPTAPMGSNVAPGQPVEGETVVDATAERNPS
jgi:hypothetical protein